MNLNVIGVSKFALFPIVLILSSDILSQCQLQFYNDRKQISIRVMFLCYFVKTKTQ